MYYSGGKIVQKKKRVIQRQKERKKKERVKERRERTKGIMRRSNPREIPSYKYDFQREKEEARWFSTK